VPECASRQLFGDNGVDLQVTSEGSLANWLNKIGVFLVACFISAALMRLLVRDNPVLFNLPMGLLCLIAGVRCAWACLRWRDTAPLRFAALLGLSAGMAGAGLFIVVAHNSWILLPVPTNVMGRAIP